MLNILIVDADVSIRSLLAAHLSLRDNPVVAVANGVEAVLSAKRQIFDLAFVDDEMPNGTDALETAKELKQINPAATVVILNGGIHSDRPPEAVIKEFEVIGKPFALVDIENIVIGEEKKRAASAIDPLCHLAKLF
ncbi:MAG: response regulator [Deltaproteobacteria bacterium]|nr:response regulator [Deltaproteobacteria bacterium]